MKGWFLYTLQFGLPEYYFKRLYDEAKLKGVELSAVAIDNLALVIDHQNSVLHLKGDVVELPDFIFIYTPPPILANFILTDFFKSKQVIVVNDMDAAMLCKNKWRSILRLAENGLPIPKSLLINTGLTIDSPVLKQFSFPLLLKSLDGFRGQSVAKIDDSIQLVDFLGILHNANPNKELLLQEYIAPSHGQDVRVFVIGGKARAAMHRQNHEGRFKSNLAQGGKAAPYALDKSLCDITERAAKCHNLDLAGVDVLFDDCGYKICEVNAFPGIAGIEKATGINLANQLITHLISLVK